MTKRAKPVKTKAKARKSKKAKRRGAHSARSSRALKVTFNVSGKPRKGWQAEFEGKSTFPMGPLDRRAQKAKRESIRARANKARAERTADYAINDAWDRWEALARDRHSSIVVDTTEAREKGLDPFNPRRKITFHILATYTAGYLQSQYDRWAARYLAGVAKSWASTGLLPFEAQEAPCEFRPRTIYKSAPLALSAIFEADFIETVAMRADTSADDARAGQYVYVLRASTWVQEKLVRKLKRKRWKKT